MHIHGERIIIFGDSLTHHGDDSAPEIWDVDQGSQRSSAQPGDLLASLLFEQGAVVRTNANVSRSALNFWNTPHPRFQQRSPEDLISSDRLFKPSLVFVMLGTNDIGLNLSTDAAAMQRIREAYRAMGAEVWAIGPPVFAALNSDPVYNMLRSVFGADRVIDARPLSATVNRAKDGVHFQPAGAVSLAANLLREITSQGVATKQESPTIPTKLPTKLLVGVGVGIGIILIITALTGKK